MNLLIALMGDTYGRVQENIVSTDFKLKAQLLWEYESMLSHNKSKG